MPRIPDTEIDRLKRSADLAALVRSRGIELKKHGTGNLVGRCPFHQDGDSPNFIVTPAKGLYHCMACGAAGNPIQFVEKFDGISFRHAFELLNDGPAAFTKASEGTVKRSRVARLEAPVKPDAEDTELFTQVVDYYHQRLLATPAALDYLKSRGLYNEDAIERFRLGFADRTLGLRLPGKERKAGAEIRTRLQKLGLIRESGHEHFNGSLVVPVFDDHGHVAEMYGRKINHHLRKGTPSHLYLPGPHAGIWNLEALQSDRELILCEAPLDALTLWVNGIQNTTFIYGTEGFPNYLFDALLTHRVKTVRLAYDADDAGNRAAARDAERLAAHGIEVYRIKFPWGMDVNTYAQKVTPSAKSLRIVIDAAEWVGGAVAPTEVSKAQEPPPEGPPLDAASQAPVRASSSLAADLAAKKETPHPVDPVNPVKKTPTLERSGEYHTLTLGHPSAGLRAGRTYRVGGLEKNNSLDVLKVAVRINHGDNFHLDHFDMTRDNERRRYIERAAEETRLEKELIKRDLGKLLLALEAAQQARLSTPLETRSERRVEMSPEERAEALAFLTSPNLIERIAETFEACGLVGETTNRLAAYLACTSRKLERPLAVIIQSTSAAGKSALMDAVLRLFPEEERVQYSAMTGQSLYYLGETDLKHKILAIVEEEGAEKASYALKLLQSEGELTIASTGKDPTTGRMETQEYHVEGPVMIFLTTTAIDIDEELQNRCLTLTVDESREQTERIHTLQRQARTREGLRLKKRRLRLLTLLRNVQRLLEPVEVVNPYADQLTFTAERTRTRRDHEKYLTLIDVITLLHQHQREREDDGEGGSYIAATLDDIALANQLAPELLGRSLDELPPQTRRLLDHARAIVRAACERDDIEPRLAVFTRRDLRELCGWTEFQVRTHLARLESLEYVQRRWGSQGKRYAYELLVDIAEPTDAWQIGLIDVAALRASHEPESVGTMKTSSTKEPTSGHFEKATPRSESPSSLAACG
jgi:DNA primase